MLAIALYLLATPFAGVTYVYVVDVERAHINPLLAFAFILLWPAVSLAMVLWLIWNWRMVA
jgi:hypothetical protein